MTKIKMAVKIASALLNTQVDKTNWKVNDLMRRTKADLASHMYLADKILTGDDKWNSGY
jgi:hypothetical protein